MRWRAMACRRSTCRRRRFACSRRSGPPKLKPERQRLARVQHSMERGRVLLIINVKSRSGEGSLPAVMSAFATHGFSILLPSESDMRDCAAAIRRMKDDVDLVVVGGGDGSLNAAAPGLL